MHVEHDTASALAVHLSDEAATLGLGEQLGLALTGGMTLYLQGDLGAGKTTLTRGILRGRGFLGRVKSPTYTLVEPYVISNINFYHFDLYRFNDPSEWADAGFRDYFNSTSVCLVEWPEQASGMLPAADLTLQLSPEGLGRNLVLTAFSEPGRQCIAHLNTCFLHPAR
ncbi:tRNA (adenosine(37)-N6)-threonylcarbamoyltransferase complex ATPase subunit type 1 TsaE [Parachitinimonas caeni]|uniref:tRNA threonylcarbamoyladenosine biosynthesis protein TsaE n=1 Tax=Parachitinimonas caeni TaxID=3031301 RepID=A0ABT7DWJ9_9NEIS|nr:tRNA (adenosine(37)-N6)-threonylcarbamoyltransferase complex ATPase subunit type 1 TsaE [Parachitinimonas caeni]MDK2123535.1 tRNA (adenosine(37)-N6)-threonylcarbamoyltransferase complex ATPase subunit type 1 TsaE [Parachitinimonas caeni]